MITEALTGSGAALRSAPRSLSRSVGEVTWSSGSQTAAETSSSCRAVSTAGGNEAEDEPEVVVKVGRFALGGVGVDGVDVDVGGLVAERGTLAEQPRGDARLLVNLTHGGGHERRVVRLTMAARSEQQPSGGVVPHVQDPSGVIDHDGAARDVPGECRPGRDLGGNIECLQ